MHPERIRPFIAAMLIDTIGTGLLGPFLLLYGHAVAGLSLASSGVCLAIGTALAIPAGPVAGALVDTLGSARVAIAANLVSALGCVALLYSHNQLVFGVSAFILAMGSRIFWAAFAPMVLSATSTSSRRAWFGRIRGLRFAGIALGQALASLAFIFGEGRGLRIVVIADAVSYVLAVGFLAAATRGVDAAPRQIDAPRAGGYREVLADRANLALATLNVGATLLATAPLLAMPVLVIDQLHLASWLPALLAALNTVALAGPTFFAARWLKGRSSLSALVLASVLWTIGCLIYVVASANVLAFALLPAGMVVLGVGEAAFAPSADTLPLELAPAGLGGRYTAIHQVAWGISGALAPILAGVLLATGNSTLWIALMVISLGLGLGYAIARSSLRSRIVAT